jgi:hypothetical protein
VAVFIASQRADHGIPQAVSCRALGVSQSWFYKWKDGDRSPRHRRRERLKAEIARLFTQRKGKDGSPRITAALRDAGWRVGENTVAALMRQMGLAARPKKNRRATTRQGKGRWRAPDLIGRQFPAGGLNRKWYGDGTEIVTDEGKLYLDSVMDMGSRRILGHALGEYHDTGLAYGALAVAVAVRGGKVPDVIFHTDQGSEEYTAGAFREACERLGIRQSVGRARLGAGQRGHRVLALHPGVRAALPAEVRDEGGGAGSGRRLDRGLQPRPPPLGAGHAVPGGLRAVPGGKGRRVSAASPLRGPGKGGGCAAAVLVAPAKRTGPPPRPQGCCASPCGRRPYGPPLTPGTPAAPGNKKSGQAQACPGQARARQGQPAPSRDHHNRSLHGFRGTPTSPGPAVREESRHPLCRDRRRR